MHLVHSRSELHSKQLEMSVISQIAGGKGSVYSTEIAKYSYKLRFAGLHIF